MTMAALESKQRGFRPEMWRLYESSNQSVLDVAKPLEELVRRSPCQVTQVNALSREKGAAASDAVYSPLIGRSNFCTIVL